ncbi:hypothetical protein SOVF_069040 [Spinacia oleracea]|nr:hypothetical protein SOVF_069040 [Spinacia oleracea]
MAKGRGRPNKQQCTMNTEGEIGISCTGIDIVGL